MSSSAEGDDEVDADADWMTRSILTLATEMSGGLLHARRQVAGESVTANKRVRNVTSVVPTAESAGAQVEKVDRREVGAEGVELATLSNRSPSVTSGKMVPKSL